MESPQVRQRILHAAGSAHDVIIYLTAYAPATPPVTQTTPRTGHKSEQTLYKLQTANFTMSQP